MMSEHAYCVHKGKLLISISSYLSCKPKRYGSQDEAEIKAIEMIIG